MSTETSIVPGGQADPMYNVFKRNGSRIGRIIIGAVTHSKTKQKRKNATTLMKP